MFTYKKLIQAGFDKNDIVKYIGMFEDDGRECFVFDDLCDTSGGVRRTPLRYYNFIITIHRLAYAKGTNIITRDIIIKAFSALDDVGFDDNGKPVDLLADRGSKYGVEIDKINRAFKSFYLHLFT